MAPAVRELGSPCAAAVFTGPAPLFALADGTIHRWDTGQRLRAHPALLAVERDGDALLTAGEDGRVCRTDGADGPVELAALPRRWIDCVAAGPGGALAFAAGRAAWLVDAGGSRRELRQARNIAGLRYLPDGSRLALARYEGVQLHAVAGDAVPQELDWKGIYTGIDVSPDGRFLLAFMQDGLLHGWRLDRGPARHFRMTGYASRIRNWSWSRDGRWLATAGAPTAVLWPFDGEDGPIGRRAQELGEARDDAPVTAVAFRPDGGSLAIGYGDGRVLLGIAGEVSARQLRAPDGAAVTAVAWHNSGAALAFGTGTGACGVLDVPG